MGLSHEMRISSLSPSLSLSLLLSLSLSLSPPPSFTHTEQQVLDRGGLNKVDSRLAGLGTLSTLLGGIFFTDTREAALHGERREFLAKLFWVMRLPCVQVCASESAVSAY